MDYWPSYSLHMKDAAAVAEGGFWELTALAIMKAPAVTLADRAAGVCRALLHVLRAARAPVAANLRILGARRAQSPSSWAVPLTCGH